MLIALFINLFKLNNRYLFAIYFNEKIVFYVLNIRSKLNLIMLNNR